MNIKIFGPGCTKCEKLTSNVEEAINQLNLDDTDIEKISDIGKMVDEGIMSAPTLMINGVIKSSGNIPSIEEIKKILSV